MIIDLFVIAAAVCAFLSTMVGVDYKFADYLPDDAQSTVALDTMNKEYNQEVPNVRVMITVPIIFIIFLLHRFAENREKGFEAQEAMVNAVKQSVGSVTSSGLTTVTGFAALILMRFKIGPDMGWVMVKAIILSLIAVLCLLPALTMVFYPLIDKTEHKSFLPKFKLLSKIVLDWKPVMIILFIIVTIPSYLGQQKNTFFYGGSRVYQTNATQLGRDMNAIEKEYGQSSQLVLMVQKETWKKRSSLTVS